MRKPRRIHLLIITFTFVLFGTIFAAAECPVCFPGSDGSVRCSAGGGGGSGGGPPGGGGPTPTAVATYPPLPTPTSIPTPVPTPVGSSIWETLGGSYANTLPCQGGFGDPIGTIFVLPASADAASAQQLAFDRLSDIGMTSGYRPVTTTRDNYLDNGACVEGAITRGTNDGYHIVGCFTIPYCIDSRWHARCIVHAQPSPYGYWASCTPHWDSGPPPSCPAHYVPEVYNGTENYGGSGYDAAWDWLWWQLIRVRGMTFVGPVSFNNRLPRSQCNGTIFSQADSKVNVIAIQ